MQVQAQETFTSRITTIGVALAGVLIIILTSGIFTIWSMLTGVVLLLLLFTYSKHGDGAQTHNEHLLTSAVLALISLLLLGWLLQPFYQILGLGTFSIVTAGFRLSITWALFAFILWLIAIFIWMRIPIRQR